MKVTVTGGAGFIGCHVVTALIERGHDVLVIDNLHPQVHARRDVWPERLPRTALMFRNDIAEPSTWTVGKWEAETVVHLAAETGTGQSMTELSRHTHTNVTGTAVMLEALDTTVEPERIVLASSRAVYGDSPNDARSASGPRPISVYAATKLAQEHLLSSWCANRPTDAVILRLQNVYGPGQSLSNPYTGIIPIFAGYALRGEPIPVYEDGMMTRDFVHVSDVTEALVAATESKLDPSDTAYDIGTGRATTVLELATMIAGYFDAPAPIVTGYYRPGDVRHAVASQAFPPDPRSLTDMLPPLLEEIRSALSGPS